MTSKIAFLRANVGNLLAKKNMAAWQLCFSF